MINNKVVNLIDVDELVCPVRTVISPKGKGALSFIEGERDIPFDIRRVYYIHGVPYGTTRGHHAHRELEQLLVCISGSIDILLDNGKERETIHLDDPSKGLYLPPRIWHTMTWLQENSILLVLASGYYDESDHIRDYREFLRFINHEEYPE